MIDSFRPEQPGLESQLQNFESLDLKEIEWVGKKQKKPEFGYTQEELEAYLPILMGGNKFVIKAMLRVDSLKGVIQKMHYDFAFHVDDLAKFDEEDSLLIAQIEINFNINRPGYGRNLVTTAIERRDPDKKLPSGIGAMFYKKMLSFIKSAALEQGVYLTHVISHETKLNMSPAEWDKVFLPIIEENGYHKMDNTIHRQWKKDYLPYERH